VLWNLSFSTMRPAFFFDRDGVVNVCPGDGAYVLRWEDFHFSQGLVESLAWLRARGFALVLVTNQQGVGKGLMTQAALDDIHARMQAALTRQGAQFDGIYACTCLKSNPGCLCHKPSPEMAQRAAREHDLDLSASWLIGDHDRDIAMAANAGIPHTIRVRGGRPVTIPATHEIDSMAELPARLPTICRAAVARP
jgi:histidinol-phosphate phosphatase family protein